MDWIKKGRQKWRFIRRHNCTLNEWSVIPESCSESVSVKPFLLSALTGGPLIGWHQLPHSHAPIRHEKLKYFNFIFCRGKVWRWMMNCSCLMHVSDRCSWCRIMLLELSLRQGTYFKIWLVYKTEWFMAKIHFWSAALLWSVQTSQIFWDNSADFPGVITKPGEAVIITHIHGTHNNRKTWNLP